MQSEFLWKEIQRIALPQPNSDASGSIHTIVHDELGNLYYSDEFNHLVASLDSQGRSRWSKGGKGQNQEQFVYPRGVRLGWICRQGEWLRTLAVCDSWNHRIQFFSLNGNYLGMWNSAVEASPFGEISDIRFLVPSSETDPHKGAWLILDRSGHCLWSVRPDGELICRIGSCTAPRIERAWAATILATYLKSQTQEATEWPLYDPAYYPDRIIGSRENALFVWEPLSKRAKQILHGNLLPLQLDTPEIGEWIAADVSGILSWDAASSGLTYLNAEGSLIARICLAGRPVFCDLPIPELWIQQGSELSLCRWQLPSSCNELPPTPTALTLLRRCSTKKLYSLLASPGLKIQVIDRLHEFTRGLKGLCRDFLESMNNWTIGTNRPMPHKQEFNELVMHLRQVRVDLETTIHSAYPELLALLYIDWELASKQAEVGFKCIRSMLDPIAEAVEKEFVCLQNYLDEMLVMQIRAIRISGKAQDDPLSWTCETLQLWQQSIQMALQELAQTNNFLQFITTMEWVAAKPAMPCDTPLFEFSSVRNANRKVSFLREIERFSVSDPVKSGLQHPYSIAQTSDRNLFVSLASGRHILKLDYSSRALKRLGFLDEESCTLKNPMSLASDHLGRLWVADSLAHQILVCDPNEARLVPFPLAHEDGKPLLFPHGICCRKDGWIMVADTGNSRILGISENGDVRPFSQSETKEQRDHHRQVLFIDPSDQTGAFWVVDHRNHCLQEFDANGNLIREIGGCGFGKGRFILPEFACFLPDGALLVSQYRFNRELKLLDRSGKELDRWCVDFAPAGILTFDKHIMIADILGDQIRIFERV
jgi:hypothetical protein